MSIADDEAGERHEPDAVPDAPAPGAPGPDDGGFFDDSGAGQGTPGAAGDEAPERDGDPVPDEDGEDTGGEDEDGERGGPDQAYLPDAGEVS